MKRRNLLAFVILAFVIISGCKKDDDTTTPEPVLSSFMLKGEKYEIPSQETPTGVIQLIHDLSEGTTTGSISITGYKSPMVGVIQLVISYITSTGVTGVYKNGELYSSDHTFDPFLSSYSTMTQSGTIMVTGSNADGTLTVTKNSSDNYTVSFNLTYADNSTSSGNITQKFVVQEVSY
jgi:hypothetical protein